jgi:AraC-like DNA-binding protein
VKAENHAARSQIKKMLDIILSHLHVKYGIATVENKKIEQSIQFIEEHYAEPIGNREIADALHIDSRHLIRLFTKYMNMPPYQYLTQCRIERSLSELRRGRSHSRHYNGRHYVDQKEERRMIVCKKIDRVQIKNL